MNTRHERYLHPGDVIAPRALVVDDYRLLRDVFSEMLFSMGYDVYQAENAGEALTVANEVVPSIVVLDYRLDDGPDTGAIVASYMRLHLRLRHAAIIGVSGTKHLNAEQEFRAAGANAFLVKPFHLTEFQRVLEEVAPRAKAC